MVSFDEKNGWMLGGFEKNNSMVDEHETILHLEEFPRKERPDKSPVQGTLRSPSLLEIVRKTSTFCRSGQLVNL